jgi:hypothetical protein
MGYPQPPSFSPVVLLSLLAVVAASSVTFWLLVRRATSHRQWVALSDWAKDSGFHFNRAGPDAAPAPFNALRDAAPTVRLSLSRGTTTLAQLEVPAPPGSAAGGAGAGAAVPNQRQRILWNLLIREIPAEWRPTGLRPAGAAASALDLFSLASFPTLGGTERFVAFGTDSADARVVSKSMLRSLLPADIGLLLHGPRLILDFSDRPFDTIEFGRMLALCDQLVTRLPPPAR